MIFIGNSFGVEVEFPQPTHGPLESETHEDSFLAAPTDLKPWATLRNAIAGLCDKEPELMDFSPRKKSFLSQVPQGGNWRSLPVEVQKESMGRAWHAKGGRSGWWRRLSWDLPCPTLVTMPNHSSTSLCHPDEIRVLSVREYARIQEFPDNWIFEGKTSEKYSQIGNAVPIRLGKVTATTISVLFNQVEAHGASHSLRDSSANFRRIYINSHIRTRKWFKSGKVFAGHATHALRAASD